MLNSPAYIVIHGSPYDRGSSVPVARSGFIPLAKFDLASELFNGYSWFTVFGTPESAIARSGKQYLKMGLREFPSPAPVSDEFGLQNVHVER